MDKKELLAEGTLGSQDANVNVVTYQLHVEGKEQARCSQTFFKIPAIMLLGGGDKIEIMGATGDLVVASQFASTSVDGNSNFPVTIISHDDHLDVQVAGQEVQAVY